MTKLTASQKEKLKTAWSLLAEDVSTIEKIEKIGSLAIGINSQVDTKLTKLLSLVSQIKKVSGGEVVELSLEKLPVKTNKDKKRKKLALLLLTSLKDLKSEVARIEGIKAATGTAQAVKAGKVITTLKGPLGAITIAAVGIVAVTAVINTQAVNITIKNSGCYPINALAGQSINLPGLKLSDTSATLLPISIRVDMTDKSNVSLSTLNFSKKFPLPNNLQEVIFDGKSLIGQNSTVNLASSKNHTLEINCR
jgi:hypothetical protein